jgi:hypothetical protein
MAERYRADGVGTSSRASYDLRRMPQPLVYVERSTVRPGALAELKAAISELAEFVDENVPQLLAYGVYFSDDGSEMTVVHVHADTASLDRYLDTAGPRFARFGDLLELSSIQLYGEASAAALGRLQEKLTLLGSGDAVVHVPHAGFSRPAGAAAL